MSRVFARGRSGALFIGYKQATRLGRWSLTLLEQALGDQRWQLTAQIVSRDDFWAERTGYLDLELELGNIVWRWPGLGVTWNESSVSITGSGPPVETLRDNGSDAKGEESAVAEDSWLSRLPKVEEKQGDSGEASAIH